MSLLIRSVTCTTKISLEQFTHLNFNLLPAQGWAICPNCPTGSRQPNGSCYPFHRGTLLGSWGVVAFIHRQLNRIRRHCTATFTANNVAAWLLYSSHTRSLSQPNTRWHHLQHTDGNLLLLNWRFLPFFHHERVSSGVSSVFFSFGGVFPDPGRGMSYVYRL